MEAAQNSDQSESVYCLEGKHKKMLWVAFWANVLFWTILVLYTVLFMGTLIQSLWILHYRYSSELQNFFSYPSRPLNYLQFGLIIFHAFANLITGVAYALASKGVSLGLKMLVETDMNYKLNREEETHA
jgi:hypothetical protein